MVIHNVSDAVAKIDWDYILDNITNRDLWKRNWTVIISHDYTAKLSIHSIDVTRNQVMFKALVKDVEGRTDYNLFYVPMSKDHRITNIFSQKLVSTIVNTVINLHRSDVISVIGYDYARKLINEEYVLNEVLYEKFEGKRPDEYVLELVMDDVINRIESSIQVNMSDKIIEATVPRCLSFIRTIYNLFEIELPEQYVDADEEYDVEDLAYAHNRITNQSVEEVLNEL